MKFIFTLSLFLTFALLHSQENEEYIDGRLIKTQTKDGVIVSTSLRAIQRNDGKYYTFDISVSNSSSNTKLVKVDNFKAFIINKKGDKDELEVLSNKEYQEKKQKRANFRNILASMAGSQNAENAGKSSSQTNTNISSSSYSSGTAKVKAYDSYGNSATAKGNYSGRTTSNTNATSTTVSYDGAAAYAAQQNEERKLQEFMQLQKEAKNKWNDIYLKSNTLSPLESMSGLLNVEYKKGVMIDIDVLVQDLHFIFKWNPEDSEK